jgi:hypothetical protein
MSYLFQATGVKNAAGRAQTRLSGEINGPVNEQLLIDGPLGLESRRAVYLVVRAKGTRNVWHEVQPDAGDEAL